MGGFAVTVDTRSVALGWRLRKAEALVKLLALDDLHRVHRERVIDALWPDLNPRAAANQLRKALHIARRALDPNPDAVNRFLVRHGEVIALRLEALLVDVAAFLKLADVARQSGTVEDYDKAVSAYGGELLPEDPYEEWTIEPRRRLEEEYGSLLLEFGKRLLARGNLRLALTHLERLVAMRPLDEAGTAELMRAEALAGRRSDALRRFEKLRLDLAVELRAEPGPEAQHMYEQIRASSSSLHSPPMELWEEVGDLRLTSGDFSGAAAAFRSAIASRNADDLFNVQLKLAHALLAQHDTAGALEQLPALGEPGALAPHDLAQVEAIRAQALAEMGKMDEAMHSASLALKNASGSGADVLATAHQAIAIVSHYRGEWPDALQVDVERLGSKDATSALGPVFDIHHCIGEFHLYGDRQSGRVEPFARDVLKTATQSHARRAEAFAWCLLGESMLLRGQFDEAAGALRRSGEIHGELGTSSGGLAWQRLAELEVCRANYDEARKHLDRATALASVSPMAQHLWSRIYATSILEALDRNQLAAGTESLRAAGRASVRYGQCPSCAAMLHPLAAELASKTGDSQTTEHHAELSAQLAGSWPSSSWRAMSLAAAASAALLRSEQDAATSGFLEAARLFESSHHRFWAARAYREAASITSDVEELQRLLTHSGDLFRSLGVNAESHLIAR